MTKAHRPLGEGEYEWVNRYTRSTEDARDQFLKAVNRIEPRVLETLRTGPYQHFSTSAPSAPSDPLTDALPKWSEQWHLNTPWVLEHARDTMAAWQLRWCPQTEWHVTAGYVDDPALSDDELRFLFEDRGWKPQREREAQARTRIAAAFQKTLDRYLESIRGRMDAAVKTGRYKPTPSKRELEQHCEWLARFQVKGESFKEIAETCGMVTADAVEVAVRRAARFIGLTLRPLPRTGRPPGRGDVTDRAPRQRQK